MQSTRGLDLEAGLPWPQQPSHVWVARRGSSTFWGYDSISDTIAAELSRAGVNLLGTQRSYDKLPSIATVMIERVSGQRSIVFCPRGDAPPEWTDAIGERIAQSKILHINGRHLPVVETAIEVAKDHGTLVSYDGGAHRYRDEIVSLLPHADILIVARQFAEAHGARGGIGGEPEKLLEKLMVDFAPQVAGITDGESGSWFRTGNDAWHQPAESAGQVLDTTGCGDTFHGAFLYAYAREIEPRQCAAYAARVAAINATRLGAFCNFRGRGAPVTVELIWRKKRHQTSGNFSSWSVIFPAGRIPEPLRWVSLSPRSARATSAAA